MAGVYQDILGIKKLREQSSAKEVTRAEADVEAAKVAVQEAEKAVLDYEDFRVEEEKRLFRKIQGEEIKVESIDKMKFDVGQLRQKTEQLKEVVEDKKKAVTAAQDALRNAEAALIEARRAVQKFDEFVAVQQEDERREAVAVEDAEVEEVSEAIFASRMKEVGGS